MTQREFKGWETGLSPDNFNLLSVLTSVGDEKWIKAATTLSETLKHQAQTEEVKIFWRNIDLKRKEMEVNATIKQKEIGDETGYGTICC
ncbi:unnamed protein product [Rhizophagus irregularis]|nr:unnamed protein product [Rhizophagus irregularis]CAB5388055.1 unnamed protein product [Rhizophagus irregularis]